MIDQIPIAIIISDKMNKDFLYNHSKVLLIFKRPKNYQVNTKKNMWNIIKFI